MDVRIAVLLTLVTATFAKSVKTKENFDASTGGHGHDIDNPDVNPDSKLENILESQVIFDGKKEKTPKNINPFDKTWEIQAENEIDSTNRNNNTKGDLTEKEKESNAAQKRSLEKRNFPKAFTFENGKLWPKKTVPYVVDEKSFGEHLDKFYSLLEDAKNIYHTETCVRFEPWSSALAKDLGHKNKVTFKNGNGCSSPVGMKKNNRIKLKMPGCDKVGFFFHEMGHTIGNKHEQDRSDRGEVLKINWKNIKIGRGHNFYTVETDNHDSYDPYSRMEYKLKAFSRNNLKTIEFKDKAWEFLVSATKSYSFYDISDINKIYKCSKSCLNPPACEHFGFVNQNCECRCPDGLIGRTCDQRDANCGSVIFLNGGESQTISSPNWPNHYDVNMTCVWMVTAPKKHRIKVTITSMDVAWNSEENRCYHWVELKSLLIGDPGIKRCGNLSNNKVVEYFHSVNDEANELMIRFDSLYANDRAATAGFTLNVQAFKSGCLDRPCKMGSTCVEGNNDFTYRCTCLPGYSGDLCTHVTAHATVKCDFENTFGRDCFLVNENEGWQITRSHSKTFAADKGVFVRPVDNDGTPSLLVSGVQFAAGDRCLVFNYFKKEKSTGKITVHYEGSSCKSRREVFATDDNTGKDWKQAKIHIPRVTDLKIIFKGEVGNGKLVAIDNVIIVPGACDVPCSITNPCLNDGECTPTTNRKSFTCNCVNGYTGKLCDTSTDDTIFKCSFEEGEKCFLEQGKGDDFDWTQNGYGTVTNKTGPSSAKDGDLYMYMEASHPRKKGDMAKLVSKEKFTTHVRCLKFFYHMYGNRMGTLKLKLNNGDVPFERTGDQGDKWRYVEVEIPAIKHLKISFDAIRGKGKRSDIAIDSVSLVPGECGNFHTKKEHTEEKVYIVEMPMSVYEALGARQRKYMKVLGERRNKKHK